MTTDRFSFFLIFYPLLLFSLSLHEAAHAYVADRRGDPTARRLGRITLNPLAHMDLLGTVILPIMSIFSGARFMFGWGKPVPVDPRHFQNERWDNLWVALWGPLSNIFLAIVFSGFFHLIQAYFAATSLSIILLEIGYMGVMLNLGLAFFNLIPIYPLDGQSVMRGLLPARLVPGFDRIMRYGMIFLIILLLSGALRFISIPIQYMAKLLLAAPL